MGAPMNDREEQLQLDLVRLVVEHAMTAGPNATTPFLAPILNDTRIANRRAEHQRAIRIGTHELHTCRWCRIAGRVTRYALHEIETRRASTS